jgi:hypothetical protein
MRRSEKKILYIEKLSFAVMLLHDWKSGLIICFWSLCRGKQIKIKLEVRIKHHDVYFTSKNDILDRFLIFVFTNWSVPKTSP